MEMDAAKRLLAPDTPLEAWHASGADGNPTVRLAADGAAVTVSSATASTRFVDNVPRVAVSALGDDGSGDSLPHTPVVLTGCCDRWPAWRGGSGESWSAERLAARLPAATQVRLDGGPGFARESLCNPFVTLQAYAQYASTTQDSASRYVLDDKVLTVPFGGGALACGIGSVIKEARGDKCKVYGCEPITASPLSASFSQGKRCSGFTAWEPSFVRRFDTF